MRTLAVALALSASLAHAQQQATCADTTCVLVVGGLLVGTLVTVSHGLLVYGLKTDNVNALAVGGWGTIAVGGLSGLAALGFLFDALLSRRDGLQVGGTATWLALSVAVAGVGAYGAHRPTTLFISPVPGGASGGLSLTW